MNVRTATSLIVMALAAPAAQTDEASGLLATLASGDRVRLQLSGSGKSLRATIESVTADELVFQPPGAAGNRRLSLADVQTLEVARGRGSRWRRGALIGFVPGALFLGLVGREACLSYEPSGCAILGAVIGGAVTGGVGALIGLAFRSDRWVRVHERKPKVALMLAPAKGQVQVSLSVRF